MHIKVMPLASQPSAMGKLIVKYLLYLLKQLLAIYRSEV